MKKKILIIDDESSTLEMLADFLGDEYELTMAEDLAAGTQHLLSEPFDALILDFRLPGRSAYDEFQALLNSERFAGLPLLMLSADRVAQERFVTRPHRAFLAKPVRPPVLKSMLRHLVTPD